MRLTWLLSVVISLLKRDQMLLSNTRIVETKRPKNTSIAFYYWEEWVNWIFVEIMISHPILWLRKKWIRNSTQFNMKYWLIMCIGEAFSTCKQINGIHWLHGVYSRKLRFFFFNFLKCYIVHYLMNGHRYLTPPIETKLALAWTIFALILTLFKLSWCDEGAFGK